MDAPTLSPNDAFSLGSNAILRDYLAIKIADAYDEIVASAVDQPNLVPLVDRVRRLQLLEELRNELDELRDEAQRELRRNQE